MRALYIGGDFFRRPRTKNDWKELNEPGIFEENSSENASVVWYKQKIPIIPSSWVSVFIYDKAAVRNANCVYKGCPQKSIDTPQCFVRGTNVCNGPCIQLRRQATLFGLEKRWERNLLREVGFIPVINPNIFSISHNPLHCIKHIVPSYYVLLKNFFFLLQKFKFQLFFYRQHFDEIIVLKVP